MRLKLIGGGGIDARISVSRIMCLGAAHARFKRGRAHLRLQRLGHSKFRRSFVKREPNLLLDERLPSFINFLSDPSDIEHRIEFCGVTYFFFCVISNRERERNLISSFRYH